ncbi:cation efflux family protein-like protein [Pseudovirgaria hyperparasitica]|uniref:Cation efflux family protein-like protein n=1 Tax=Pseudovirgaria hyperparasitica TaxID=470096 RepID=A0A6A6WHA7_9PEZI|nr:cation efflux family protein-like protein [Pseudovirgaria hyperparasitica]KAF2761475.1 cation efflux family protein-like protein [Pseudovirgaria hyperparasitica]
MASNMPVPLPPRTPTPPPDEQQPIGLGLDKLYEDQSSPTKLGYGLDSLSPLSENFSTSQFASLAPSSSASPRSAIIPGSAAPYTPYTPMSATSEDTEPVQNPFNFQTVTYTASKAPPSSKSDIGRRRGHKYKHSSVSHQIFLEPPPNRAPLQLPASLPIPTWREYWSSMSHDQALRGAWCFCHLTTSGFVFWGAHESLALTVLSRLLFFDALGAFLCVAVDVGGNFEAWMRSSIRHPFGFERAEVVAGLGMSVGLLFMGLDLISHSLTHVLEDAGSHAPHHSHGARPAHERVSPGSIDVSALLAIAVTLTSALVLKNHARIGRVMRIGYFSSLPSILSNPSHFLTLSCSALLLLLPLMSIRMYVWLDRSLALVVAVSMIVLGWRMGWRLGKMLMMSYAGPGISDVLFEIQSDPSVSGIEEAKFWQVHYGLCQANLKLKVRDVEDGVRLRERIASLVRNKLGGGYGSGGQKWEVSTQLMLEKD